MYVPLVLIFHKTQSDQVYVNTDASRIALKQNKPDNRLIVDDLIRSKPKG